MTMPSPSPRLSDEAIDRYKTGAEHKKLIGEQIATVWTDDLLALIAELRSLRSSPPSTGDGERKVALRPMKDAPRDGTEILAWSEAGNFHQVIWKSHEQYRWLPAFSPHWGMRWNDNYHQSDGQFLGWIPMPIAAIRQRSTP
jgi:hypothetical protein